MAGMSRSTGARVSIASAVPAGEVIAREEVLGMVRPQAATMATMMGVVRLPGRPPTQCLSTTGRTGQVRVSPAPVSAIISARVNGRAEQAVMKEER